MYLPNTEVGRPDDDSLRGCLSDVAVHLRPESLKGKRLEAVTEEATVVSSRGHPSPMQRKNVRCIPSTLHFGSETKEDGSLVVLDVCKEAVGGSAHHRDGKSRSNGTNSLGAGQSGQSSLHLQCQAE